MTLTEAFALTMCIFLFCIQVVSWVAFILYGPTEKIFKTKYHIILLTPGIFYIYFIIREIKKQK